MILSNGFSWPPQTRKAKPPQELVAVNKQPNFALDELGGRGEEIADQVRSISARIEELLLLREEFGTFVGSFDELMGAHRQARTRLAEQSAVLTHHVNSSTLLRKQATDLQAQIAAAEAEVVGLRQELAHHQQQAHAHNETINALKLDGAESASRAVSLERQLVFEKDKNTTLTDAHAAKDTELKNLDQQSKSNQREIVELKTALTNATSETSRLQKLLDEIQPDLQRAKQRHVELESALQKSEASGRASDEKIAKEKKERESLVEKHKREKYDLSSTISSLNLQLDGLNNRHAVTLKHLDHARASYDENFESLKQSERSGKQSAAALTAAERRLQLSEEQLAALETQRADLEKSLTDLTARNDMLTKAIAAKDAQINNLQSKATSFENRLTGVLQSHESDKLQHEATKRTLLEQLESERAERALAQGALTISRASREKISAQLEAMKRGRASNIVLELANEDADNDANVHVVPASNEAPAAQRNESNG